MNNFHCKSTKNLYSLYSLLSNYNEEISYLKFNSLKVLKAKSSIWPNLVFCSSYNFMSNGIQIVNVSKTIKDQQLPPLVLINSREPKFDLLKENGFYLIEQWVLMNLDIRELKIKNNFNATYQFKKISNIDDIKSWTLILSKNLFSGKELNYSIFEYLLNNNCDLYALEFENSIIGTALLHYDNCNTAGIFMFSINEEHRGCGLGKELMTKILYCIKKKGIKEVVLQSTKLGIPLYNKLNFKETGIINLVYKVK